MPQKKQSFKTFFLSLFLLPRLFCTSLTLPSAAFSEQVLRSLYWPLLSCQLWLRVIKDSEYKRTLNELEPVVFVQKHFGVSHTIWMTEKLRLGCVSYNRVNLHWQLHGPLSPSVIITKYFQHFVFAWSRGMFSVDNCLWRLVVYTEHNFHPYWVWGYLQRHWFST